MSVKFDPEYDNERFAPENAGELRSLYSTISLAERLIIFRRITSRLYSNKKAYLKSLFGVSSPSEDRADKIAYLKNSYNDAAYIAFADHLDSPKSYYAQSVSEICEAVNGGHCEFCILPIETSNEGKLLSFYRSIIKWGLKINLVYDMQSRSGDEYTRYALLSRDVYSGIKASNARNKEQYFDFLVTAKDGLSISEITMAAELCSLDVASIDTIKATSERGKPEGYFCLSLKIYKGDFNTFLSYLAVDCPDFIPLGIYTRI